MESFEDLYLTTEFKQTPHHNQKGGFVFSLIAKHCYFLVF